MKKFYRQTAKSFFAAAMLAIPALSVAQLDSAFVVSDSTWAKSDSVTPSTVYGYWDGVNGVLPDSASYNTMATIGQPYGYHSIDSVEGAYVISTGNNITYFRKQFMMDTLNDLSVRVRVNVDDHTEVYINGQLLVGVYDTVESTNWHNPPFDILINEDGTYINGYMSGEPYDSVTSTDMDSLFNIGANEIVFVCRNLSNPLNRGGFSFRLDVKGTPGVATTGNVSSSIAFTKSTVVTQSSFSGNWDGVNGTLPPDSTFTLPSVKGQPYPYYSIDSVPGADVIKTENNITYYRYEFDITTDDSLNARFRMNVDDAMEIYINGFFIAREGNTSKLNWRNPNHDIKFHQDGSVTNGYMLGDSYDAFTFSSLGDIFNPGTNELILVIRNQPKAGDAGGFSFRMDLDSDGEEVILDNKTAPARIFTSTDGNPFTADIYPNPTSGWLNVVVEEARDFDVYIYDMNGRLLTSMKDRSYTAGCDISEYARGVYFVKVVASDRTYTTKIMKQ